MPFTGWPTVIKVGGTSSALANEATTKRVANTVYQITNASRRVLDPQVAVSVDVDGIVSPASAYTIDYMFGKVTFAAEQTAGAVVRVVSGAYMSPLTLAEAKECTISLARDIQESTVFTGDGYKTRLTTLKSASGSLAVMSVLHVTPANTGQPDSFIDWLNLGAAFLMEVNFGGTGNIFRAWVLLEKADEKIPVDGLYEGSVGWQSTSIQGTGQTESALFGFGT
jgi:hypothetical protein